jgi:putative endonuclease
MAIVYVLWSQSLQKRYVGSTLDLDKRTREHNAGGSRFTSGGRPWVVVHVERCDTVPEARKRELHLKSGIGRAWLDSKFPKTKRSVR